jgi:hypothetical protein
MSLNRFIALSFRLLVIAACCAARPASAQLRISEVCSRNSFVLADSDGDYPDWIELWNSGPHIADVTGFGLSDRFDADSAWILPSVLLAPDQRLIVFASGKNRAGAGQLHTDFRIEAGSESVFLLGPQGEMLDVSPASDVPENHSIGRHPEQPDQWMLYEFPSPWNANACAVCVALPEQWTGIFIPVESGVVDFPLEVPVYWQAQNVQIHYALGGDEPAPESPVWSGSLSFGSPGVHDGLLRFIPTSDVWEAPDGNFPQALTVRFAAFRNGVRMSDVVNRTYFSSRRFDHDEGMAVTAVTVPVERFFSEETGIYVPGKKPFGNFAYHGREWERSGVTDFFVKGGHEWSGKTGLRIHGRSSRTAPQKSLRLYADRYSSDGYFDWPLVSGHDAPVSRIVLKGPDRLFSSSMFTDELANDIVTALNVDHATGHPSVLYLNGEYWGIHSLRARLDAQWIAARYDLPEGGIDLLDYDGRIEVEEGDPDAWNALEQVLLRRGDAGGEQMRYVKERVDIPSFIDYLLAELYFANGDFPVNNVKLWRPRTDGGKWRFLFFDCDACLQERRFPERHAEWLPESAADPVSLIYHFLIRDPEFSAQFASRAWELMSTAFGPSRMLELIDRKAAIYRTELERQIRRWHYPESAHAWERSVNALRRFAVMRPASFAEELSESLESPFLVYPNPADTHVTIRLRSGGEWVPGVLSLTGMDGREILRTEFNTLQETARLDVSGLAPGMYMLGASTAARAFFHKVVIW